TMMYEPSSGMTNSTIALLEEPSRTVGMPRNWLLGLPSIHTRSKIVPTTWKLDVLLGPTLSTWSLTRSPALAGSGRLHAVVHAVEDDVGGLCRTHAVAVEHVQRGAVDLALARVPARGSTTTAPYIPDAMCSRIIGVPQWYMKTPG